MAEEVETTRQWFIERVELYVIDALEMEDRMRFEAMMAADATLLGLVDAARRADEGLRNLFSGHRATADLEDRMITRLRKEKLRRPLISPVWRRALTSAAAAVVLAGVGYGASGLMASGKLPTMTALEDIFSGKSATALSTSSLASSTESSGPRSGISPTTKSRLGDQEDRWLDSDGTHRGIDQDGKDSLGRSGGYVGGDGGGGGEFHKELRERLSIQDARVSAGVESSLGLRSGIVEGSSEDTLIIGGQKLYSSADSSRRLSEMADESQMRDKEKADMPLPAVINSVGGINGKLSQEKHESDKPADVASGKGTVNYWQERFASPATVSGPSPAASSADGGAVIYDLDDLRIQPSDRPISHEAGLLTKQSEDKNAQYAGNIPARPAAPPRSDQPASNSPLEAGGNVDVNTQQPPKLAQVPDGRKIIRSGSVDFEVESFDATMMRITQIVNEEGGFVATVDSQKLPNGRTRGTITVRLGPDRLDTLVLKLRALGDLKGQQIGAQDVTKQYTDYESQLRAARAMEGRLLELIKTGKGQIKDLLAAEQELGVWRTKIESLQGELQVLQNQVSLSTLKINLSEKDIAAAATTFETETANMSVESEDVEKARAEAIKKVDEVKGRIIQAELKTYAAGQLSATVIADVPADVAGAVIDRLRQLGKVTRLEINRQQSTPDGTEVPPGTKIQRKDTRLILSLYNLANIAPRQTVAATLAASDVQKVYQALSQKVATAGAMGVQQNLQQSSPTESIGTISFQVPAGKADALLEDIKAAGQVMNLSVNVNPDQNNSTEAKRGFTLRIVSAGTVMPRQATNLNVAVEDVPKVYKDLAAQVTAAGGVVLQQNMQQSGSTTSSGSLVFQVPTDKADAMQAAVGAAGQVMSLSVTVNPDQQNSTDARRGYSVQIIPISQVAPRQTLVQTVATDKVADSYQKLLALAQDPKTGARILNSSLDQSDARNVSALVDLEIPAGSLTAVQQAVDGAGDVLSKTVNRSSDQQNTVESKLRYQVSLVSADRVSPRQMAAIQVQADEVDKALAAAQQAATEVGGKATNATLSKTDRNTIGTVVIDVPEAALPATLEKIKALGKVRDQQSQRNEQVAPGKLTRARISLTLVSADTQIVGEDNGLGSTLLAGLRTSVAGLLWSVQLVVVGICLIAPWILALWGTWRLSKKWRRKPVPATVPAEQTNEPAES